MGPAGRPGRAGRAAMDRWGTGRGWRVCLAATWVCGMLGLGGQVLAQAPDGEGPTVAARVDKKEGTVGDVFRLTVTAVGPAGVPPNLPAVAKLDLAPFDILSTDPTVEEKDLGNGRRQWSFHLDVAAYETGELTIPPIPVTYIGQGGRVGTRRTDRVPVKIASLIANEPDAALKDLDAPVVVVEQDLTLAYVAGGLLAALLGGLVAWHIRRRWRARVPFRPAPPPRPAHEVALSKLDRLATQGLADGADVQAFFFELSEVVREYLGARFGFPALEMTTEELVAELEKRAPRGLVLGETEGWLAGCDLVKFAKLAPSTSQARGALEHAIRMVETTRPRLEPPSGEAGRPPPPESTLHVQA